MEKTDIRSLTYTELEKALEALSEKKFRAGQIYDWLHNKQAESFEEMTNLSKDLRKKCTEHFLIACVTPIEVLESKIDGTKKYLFRLQDNHIIESVFMRYEHGNSVCVSSQVGCRMGCRFCASTIDGLQRNLLPGEMLGQIYGIMKETGERISNVVVMGSGEPLDNYDNLLHFIEMLTDERGLHISQRNVTVSTCGLVPQMKQLADKDLQITLAISLHAATDEKRRSLMPIANRYSLSELIEACRYYFEQTGRRLTFEYSLVGGVNDTNEDVIQLTKLLKGINCHINLIPVNPIKERDYIQSGRAVIEAFKNKLEKNHFNVTIRREMGRDIDGACGQLRRRYLTDKEIQINN